LTAAARSNLIWGLPLFVFGVALLALPVPARAAQTDVNALIDRLQSKYSRMQGLEADFVQIYHGVDGRVLRERGHVTLKRPRKARWDYETPERKVFLSDGSHIFFYVAGERHATRASLKQSADPQIPFLFLLGRGNLRRDFSRIAVMTSERPVAGGDVVLMLAPRRAPEDFKQLLAEIDVASAAVVRLVIFQRNGARMDFALSNVRENYVAPDSMFRFAAPAGVTIEEVR